MLISLTTLIGIGITATFAIAISIDQPFRAMKKRLIAAILMGLCLTWFLVCDCYTATTENLVGLWEVRGGTLALRSDMTTTISASGQSGTWHLEDKNNHLILDLEDPIERKVFTIRSVRRERRLELGVLGYDGIIELTYVGEAK